MYFFEDKTHIVKHVRKTLEDMSLLSFKTFNYKCYSCKSRKADYYYEYNIIYNYPDYGEVISNHRQSGYYCNNCKYNIIYMHKVTKEVRI